MNETVRRARPGVSLYTAIQEGLQSGMTSPVTPEDVVGFMTARLNRAKTNLVNAESRKDKRAADNIRRKISIYKYAIEIMNLYMHDGEDINKKIVESGEI